VKFVVYPRGRYTARALLKVVGPREARALKELGGALLRTHGVVVEDKDVEVIAEPSLPAAWVRARRTHL
jgi:hypothetical protein